jgi:glycopeptide antibiotics resistance protein
MKIFPKTVLALYVLVLLRLVLFKFSLDLPVVLDYNTRILNLIPFADFSQSSWKEIALNFVVFVPFGLLLCVNFKRTSFWQKLAVIFISSLAAEVIQFIFAIGRADITDVITNTLGGLVGLALYSFGKKYIHSEKLDRTIVICSVTLLILFILLRVLFFKVSYHSPH